MARVTLSPKTESHRFIRLTKSILSTLVLFVAMNSYSDSPTLEDYARLPSTSLMSVSNNGEMVAFRKPDGEENLIIVYSFAKQETVKAFRVGDLSVEDIYFLDNNRLILEMSKNRRMFGFRGAIDLSTAFVYDLKKDKMQQLLTPGDNIYLGQSGLGNIIAVDKSNEYVYMPAFVETSSISVEPPYGLMKVKLDRPKRPKVVKKGRTTTIKYFVDDSGTVLARVDYDNKTNIFQIRSLIDNKWKTIFEEEMLFIHIGVAGLTPKRDALVISETSDESDRRDIRTLSLTDGEIKPMKWGRSDADIEQVITDKNSLVFGVRYSGFLPSYKFFDEALDKKIQEIVAKFPNHAVYLRSWSQNWKNILVYVEGYTSSGAFYLFRDGKKPIFASSVYPNIDAEDIFPVEKINVKARDGRNIPTLLTLPTKNINKLENLPAIMLPHGGPEAYDRIGFDWTAQALANEGYLVIQPQFRGSKGFGLEHVLAGRGQWGKAMQDDLTDTLQYLVKNKIVDGKRVCIVGSSYGGYAALAGAAFTPDLYKCVVSINGVSDLPKMLSQEKSDHGFQHEAVSYWEAVIKNGNEDKQFLKDISPYYAAENITAPVMLLYGSKDEIVSPTQSKRMAKALKKQDKIVTTIELKDENHFLEYPETRQQALFETIRFVDSHLKKDEPRAATAN